MVILYKINITANGLIEGFLIPTLHKKTALITKHLGLNDQHSG
jgi:hypothetical protein